jgi:hypothetical protein
MVVLLELCAFDVFVLARVSVSVLPIANLSRTSQSGFVAFADNFLNDYSGVKNITQAPNRYHCSGFRPRRFALR